MNLQKYTNCILPELKYTCLNENYNLIHTSGNTYPTLNFYLLCGMANGARLCGKPFNPSRFYNLILSIKFTSCGKITSYKKGKKKIVLTNVRLSYST